MNIYREISLSLKQRLRRAGEFLQKSPRQIIFFENLMVVPGHLYKETVNATRRKVHLNGSLFLLLFSV
jgi:hypothetical protein